MERFDTSKYEFDRPLLIDKNKKVIDLIKDELSGKRKKQIVTLRPKMYSFPTNNDRVDKKVINTKRVIKREKTMRLKRAFKEK